MANFYDNIDRKILLTKLNNLNVNGYSLKLIESAIENTTVPYNYSKKDVSQYYREKGIPQGLGISNFLAQVYLLKFDDEIRDEKCFMIRYVDDILILCNVNRKENLLNTITSKLQDLNLEINERKTYHGNADEKFEFLGYVFNQGNVTIADKNIQKRINLIAAKFRWFKNGWEEKNNRPNYLKNNDNKYKKHFINQLNNQITGVIFKGKKRSFLDYFREIDDLSILYRLDKIVERFFKKTKPFNARPKEVKSFVTVYFEVKYNKMTTYLLDLDRIHSIKDKREHLIEIGYIERYKKYLPKEIEAYFENYSRQQVKNNIKFSYTNS